MTEFPIIDNGTYTRGELATLTWPIGWNGVSPEDRVTHEAARRALYDEAIDLFDHDCDLISVVIEDDEIVGRIRRTATTLQILNNEIYTRNALLLGEVIDLFERDCDLISVVIEGDEIVDRIRVGDEDEDE